LNRGRQLYSAGRPSRWALAHISSLLYYSLMLFCETKVCISWLQYHICWMLI